MIISLFIGLFRVNVCNWFTHLNLNRRVEKYIFYIWLFIIMISFICQFHFHNVSAYIFFNVYSKTQFHLCIFALNVLIYFVLYILNIFTLNVKLNPYKLNIVEKKIIDQVQNLSDHTLTLNIYRHKQDDVDCQWDIPPLEIWWHRNWQLFVNI